MNTDNSTIAAWVARGRFRVLAIDGGEVAGGDELIDLRVGIGAGGRVDLGVRVPDAGAVRVQVAGASLVVGPAGSTAPTAAMPAASCDPIAYGTPAPPPFDPSTADRRFAYDIGRLPGFLGGHPGWWWTINGDRGALGRRQPRRRPRRDLRRGLPGRQPRHLDGTTATTCPTRWRD